MTLSPGLAPAELAAWFEQLLTLADGSLFAVAPAGPHRDAVIQDAIRRNARVLVQAPLDSDGTLYSPLCFFLAAACRHLQVDLSVGHWRAALENLSQLVDQLKQVAAASTSIGLPVGTPAQLFQSEFSEAIRQTGMLEGASFLSKEDRLVALGLAVNWAIRLLLAYATESTHSQPTSGKKDLAWIASIVRHALDSSGTNVVPGAPSL